MSDRREHHYVPILKGKAGEFGALDQLRPTARKRVTPLVEVFTVPYDWKAETFKKTLEEHLSWTVTKLAEGWQADKPVWLDMLWHEASAKVGLQSAVERLHELARSTLLAVPVGGPGRSDDHTASVKRVAAEDRRGAVLRLDSQDLEIPEAIGAVVDRWLRATELSPANVDLVVDLGPVAATHASSIALGTASILPMVPHLNEWRTFTLASGAFPATLSEIGADSIARLERADWRLWRSVSARSLPRAPAFGDYAVGHPDLVDPDPRKTKFSAAIRYATNDEWAVVKGRSIEKGRFAQFHELSKAVGKLDEWKWLGHCDGCEFIVSCAGEADPETWRTGGGSRRCIT